MRRLSRGFTVVEILLSVVIISMVGAAVYRVFAVSIGANQRVYETLKEDLAVLSAGYVLERDFNNAVWYSSRPFEGNFGSIVMTIAQEDGLSTVSYREDGGCLLRSQSEAGGEEVILSELKSLSFSFGYLKKDSNRNLVIWKDRWSQDSVPFLVRWSVEIWDERHKGSFFVERTVLIPHGEWGAAS